MRNRRIPDEIYDARWIARITSKCIRDEKTGCLLWQGLRTYNGYAQDQYRGKTKGLHRLMYQVVNKIKLTSDIDVCHKCDIRHCIEPTHLWAGTRKANMRDCSAKGRADRQWMTHCKRGHEFTPENTYTAPGRTMRQCRECDRMRQRKSRKAA